MKRLLEAFDKAYIINLESRKDRYVQTVTEFARWGIEVPSEKVTFYTATRPESQGEFPTLGARGSFTSHLAVLEQAIADRVNNALIFEDDIRFNRVDEADVTSIIETLRRIDWDIIYFGYLLPRSPNRSASLVASVEPTRGGHFYGVNGRFIQDMAQFMQQCLQRPAGHPDGGPMFRDGAYNHILKTRCDLKVFLAMPNLATQRSSRTDLHDLKIHDKIRVLSPLVSLLRALRNAIRA